MKKTSLISSLKGALCTMACFSFVSTYAQVSVNAGSLNYQQDFNTLDTANTNSSNLPPGWAIFEHGSSTTTVNNQYKGNTGAATTGDVYSYGSSGSTERALGSIGTSGNKQYYGVVFVNNTGVTLTAAHITYRGEQWRRGTCTSDTLLFRYSTSASGIADTAAIKWTTFQPLSLTGINAAAPTGTALDGNASANYIIVSDTLQVSIAPGDSLLLEWTDKDVSGSDNGLAIDDLNVTFIPDSPPIPLNIYLTSKSPYGPGIDPATNALHLTFDHPIGQGSGQLILQKVNGPALSIILPSPQISITDSAATVSGILLDNNSAYYVLLTAGSFVKMNDTIPNLEISDTAYWAFHTADTVVPLPLTTLSESFGTCTDSAIGLFRQYNVQGFKTWRCSATGHNNDSAAVSMSGGISDGISDSNTDWLISSSAFNFSGMVKPELSFWQKRRFTGQVSRAILVSTDYVPGSNPATATWTTLPVQDMVDDPAETWMPVSDIDLAPYKNTPFFLAFTYTCGENGAYELSYDDITVQDETLGIPAVNRNRPVHLRVMGNASGDNIDLEVMTEEAGPVTFEIIDLNGRRLFKTVLNLKKGTGRCLLKDTKLRPGMYLIRGSGTGYQGMVKVLVR